MTPYIVDASVGIKWLLPEPKTREALRVRSSGPPLHVPSFFDLEVTSVLVKKHRAGLLTEMQATRFVAQLPLLPLTRHAEQTLLPQAYEIAIATKGQVVFNRHTAMLAGHDLVRIGIILMHLAILATTMSTVRDAERNDNVSLWKSDNPGCAAGRVAHRIFKLATAISASSAELIQNLTTILISWWPANR